MRDRWYADVKVRLLDGSTKRVQRVSPVQTKKGAVKFERQLREAVLNGEYNVAKKRVLCFADFVSDFITYSKTHNKPSTVENKIIILNNELLPCFGKMRLDQISVIGFDMDYTLARYKRNAFESLAHRLSTQKLIARGYPATLQDHPYQPDFVIRGLTVDKQLGNILKLDRHRHVARACHGRFAPW